MSDSTYSHSLALKQFWITMIVVVLGSTAFLFGSLEYASRPSWPAVDDYSALTRDCALLVDHPSTTHSDPKSLPDSITRLKPRRVFVLHAEYIQIVTAGGAFGDYRGYLVFPSLARTELRSTAHPSTPTEHPLVFKFEASSGN